MKIVNKKISDLIPAEYNPRTLSADQRDQISASLKRFGFVDPVIVNTHADRENIIVGGHMRTRVAREELGLSEVPCVEVELTLDQERELNIRLNKNSGEWDFEALGNYFEIDELTEWGFDLDELDLCLEDEDEPEVEEDDFDEEPPEEPKTELGRIYQLGKHRLMCGDSTSEADVKRLIGDIEIDLVHTDPPYGINEQGDRSKRKGENSLADGTKYEDFIDDSIDYAIKAFNIVQSLNIKTQIWWGANYYCHHLPQTNNWLIWDKRVEEKQQDLNSDCELAWVKSSTNSCRIFRHLWKGMIKGSEHGQHRVHPTQKPIALAQHCFARYGKEANNILDLFGGSGSTLIACEETDRSCFMMEFSPHYCDVIVKRYCKLKGIDPEEVFETGVAK